MFRSVLQVEFGGEALAKMLKKALLPQICVLNWRLIVGSISRSQLKALDGDNILKFGQKEACDRFNWCSTSTRSTGNWKVAHTPNKARSSLTQLSSVQGQLESGSLHFTLQIRQGVCLNSAQHSSHSDSHRSASQSLLIL